MSARLRHLETVESLTQVGAFGVTHWSNTTAITGVAETLLPAGSVGALLTITYAVEAIAAGLSAGGVTTCAPGATAALYNAGGLTLTLAVTAGGAASLAVTAGADTFNAALWLVWV